MTSTASEVKFGLIFEISNLNYPGKPGDKMNFNPDMEKWAEWPAQGRAAVSPFPG